MATFVRSPAFFAVLLHRFGYWVSSINTTYKNPVKLFLKTLYFGGKFLAVFLVKIDILVTTNIGPGFYLSNKGNIIIGAISIGSECSIGYNTTIGEGPSGEVPTIGDNVRIGHDSIVFGAISIGDNVQIGDKTVLGKSLPSGIRVVGNPCKVIRKNTNV